MGTYSLGEAGSGSLCIWDDYSLRVENLPKAPQKPGQLKMFGEEAKG
jgi:hypothetical protein